MQVKNEEKLCAILKMACWWALMSDVKLMTCPTNGQTTSYEECQKALVQQLLLEVTEHCLEAKWLNDCKLPHWIVMLGWKWHTIKLKVEDFYIINSCYKIRHQKGYETTSTVTWKICKTINNCQLSYASTTVSKTTLYLNNVDASWLG